MKRLLLYAYLPLTAIYLLMSYIYPTDPATIARRDLTMREARIMALSVAITFSIIWFVAFYGSWRLKNYALKIKKYPDGKGFMQLAIGMQILAFYLPIRAVVKIVLNFIAFHHPPLATITNLIITYFSIVMPLIAYKFMSHAARHLSLIAKARMSLHAMYVLVTLFCLVGVTYCFAIARAKHILSPSDWLITTDYNIATPILILTVIVPYLFAWFIGFIAAYEIHLYQNRVKGVVYRRSLRLLSYGLSLEILASILVQYITAVTSAIEHLSNGEMVSIVFFVLILVAVAFGMIARGVRKLQRLEEV